MVFDKVRDREWFELPPLLAAPSCLKLVRSSARRTSTIPKNLRSPRRRIPPPRRPWPVARLTGLYNDFSCPFMGKAGTRFGRNTPIAETFPDTANLMNPSPRAVSLALFTRTQFEPVPFLNVLAAAWIQFQVHDWFQHTEGILQMTRTRSRWRHGTPGTSIRCACRSRRLIHQRSQDRRARPVTPTKTHTGGMD